MININLQPRHLMGLCIATITLVCCTAIYTLWQWRNDWILAHTALTPLVMTHSSQATDLIAAIPEAHLFGKSFADGGDMPITNLQLRVTGIDKVIMEHTGTVSKAYISMSGQPSKIYQVGDSLPYGVKVYAINTNAIILENDGHLEKLPLPREPLLFKPRNTEGA